MNDLIKAIETIKKYWQLILMCAAIGSVATKGYYDYKDFREEIFESLENHKTQHEKYNKEFEKIENEVHNLRDQVRILRFYNAYKNGGRDLDITVQRSSTPSEKSDEEISVK
jgi:predicted nuclease with TOPRIM domain